MHAYPEPTQVEKQKQLDDAHREGGSPQISTGTYYSRSGGFTVVRGDAHLDLFGEGQANVHDNASVTAYKASRVNLWDNATATVYGPNTIVSIFGGTVYAYGPIDVSQYGTTSTVYAYHPQAIVYQHGVDGTTYANQVVLADHPLLFGPYGSVEFVEGRGYMRTAMTESERKEGRKKAARVGEPRAADMLATMEVREASFTPQPFRTRVTA